VAKFLWGNAAVLLLVVLALSVVFLGDLGEPHMFFNPRESLVDEGVAMVMVCGKQPTSETVNMTTAEVVRYRSHAGIALPSIHRHSAAGAVI
jgi:hypothetical protein